MANDSADDGGKEDAYRLAMAIAGSGTGIWDRDLISGDIEYSAAWKAILGYTESEIGNRIEDSYQRVHPDELAMVQATIRAHVTGLTPMYQVEHRLRCKDGSYKWVLSRGQVSSRDANGTPLRMTGTTTDISGTVALSDKLRQSAELLANLTDEVPGLVYQYRQEADGSGSFPYVSAGIADIYGITAGQAVASAAAVEAVIHPGDLALYRRTLAESAATLAAWRLEFRVLQPGRDECWRQGHARPRRLSDGSTLWHGFVSDITQRKQIERQLQDAAATDFLTGLPNRRNIMMRMDQELERVRRCPTTSAAVLMFDLDHFKLINDGYGHAKGDEVLKAFSQLLRHELRKIDAAGRVGGEEFAAVLSGASIEEAEGFAQRVRARLAATRLRGAGPEIAVTVSIGITTMRAADANISQSLSRADSALYRAKRAGRDRIELAGD
jgi:diguanylate cyclase (GGDEF)-like protein/PAS domain S-box-containing protein